MNGLLQDVRFASRSFLKSPGFAAVAVLTLALGIAASSTLFSMLDAVLLRPLPFKDPNRVVEIWARDSERRGRRVPGAILDAIRARSRTVGAVAIHGPDGGTLQTSDGAVRIFGRHVSPNYLEVLGVQPFIGRGFLPHEGDPAAPAVAVVSHQFWLTRLAGDLPAIGRTLTIDAISHTIVGVMPASFTTSFQRRPDEFWTPFIRQKLREFEREAGFEVIGRLTPNATLAQAQRELRAIGASVDVPNPDWRGQYVDVVSKKEEMIGDSARALQMLFGAVGVVLLITCANLALLSMARADRRVAEFATRKAIGAPTGQLFRFVLIESVLLSMAGVVAGIALSHWMLPVMLALAPSEVPRIALTTIDWRVMGFAAVVGIVTACAFGLAPALRLSRLSTAEMMKRRRGTPSVGSARLRTILVTGQVAASVALLVLAGLIGRTFLALLPSNPGFDSTGLTVMYVSVPSQQAGDRSRSLEELRQRLEATPGIAEAGFALNVPFGHDDGFRVVRDVDESGHRSADVRSVSTNFFELFGIAIRKGRSFNGNDRAESVPRVAIVNETMARRLAPTGDVLGRRLQVGGVRTRPGTNAVIYEIVGVVADARSSGTTADIWDEVYIPHAQGNPAWGAGYLIVRTQLDNGAVDRVLRKEIRSIWPQWVDDPVPRAISMDEVVSQSLAGPRFSATMIAAFSTNALLLTAVGVFGLVAYSVSLRRSEFGIRAALGAHSHDLLIMTIRSVLVSTAAGVVVGIATALYVTRLLESQLYGFGPHPLAFVGAALAMLAVALAAAYVPARRAARVDPLVALRYE